MVFMLIKAAQLPPPHKRCGELMLRVLNLTRCENTPLLRYAYGFFYREVYSDLVTHCLLKDLMLLPPFINKYLRFVKI
jgi:hypothetical protein